MKAGRQSQANAARDAKIALLADGPAAVDLGALGERFGLTRERIAQIVLRERMKESQGMTL